MANKYWVADSIASFNSIYWSSTSGGPTGAGIPGPLDNAIFDENSGPCRVDADATIDSLTLNHDYSSTLTYLNPIYLKSLNLYGGNFSTLDSSVFVTGDVSCLSGFGTMSNVNNAVAVMCGPEAQYITGGGIFPNLVINKTTTNQVKLKGPNPFCLYGNLVVWDGTFNTNGIDIALIGPAVVPTPPPVPIPIADFTWSINGGNALQIDFTDLSLNTPTSWDWNWGDGSTHGILQNPSHIYADYYTSYSVTLNSTNIAGTGSITKSILTGHYFHVDYSWGEIT